MTKISISSRVPYTNAATGVRKVEPVSACGDASARHPEDQEARLLAQGVAQEYNLQLFTKDGEVEDAPVQKRLLAIT